MIVSLEQRLQQKMFPDYVGDNHLEKTLGDNSLYALEKKYLNRDENGNLIETPSEAIYRVARTMAEVEYKYGKNDEQVDYLTKEFYEMIAQGWFSPAGRIWTNAGTSIKGLFNCYVLPIVDSLDEIYQSVKNAALVHKNGGGTGYNFSALRPRGTYVKKSKGIASGPISFIKQFDKETEIINSGNRRGANMGILDITHPDILDFIYAKTERKEITNFNISVGAFDAFMQAVKNKEYYNLEFPIGQPFNYIQLQNIIKNIEENKLGGAEVGELPKPSSLKFDSKNDKVVFGETKVIDSYSGKIAGKISEDGNVQLYAPYVFDVIAELAWKTADPGLIFLDEINRFNPLPKKGPIRATNPCGEQPLHSNDACNLGSLILSNMIKRENIGSNGDTKIKSSVDYNKIDNTLRRVIRFMDNVNDANKGPIPEIEQTVLGHRRIGLGVMGWADMLAEMKIPYDSEEALKLAGEVMGFISEKAKHYSAELAKEKGVFLEFENSKYNTGKLEDRVRNVERTTIAPTGTISMVYDVASGIEPFFAITWKKNIRGGDSLQYTLPTFIKECQEREIDLEKIIPLIEENHGSIQGIKEIPEDLQMLFKTAHDLNYKNHIKIQAAFQRVTDNAVSKTINMPNNATVEDVRNAYFMAWENKLKGITVYRDGSLDVQVLETGHKKRSDLNGTIDKPLKIPAITTSIKIRQKTPFGNMHTFIVLDSSNNYRPIETFATLGNAGSHEIADLEALGRSASLYLRSGGDLKRIIDQWKNIGSGTSTVTRDGGVQSLPMGYARALAKYEIIKEKYSIEDLILGKIDLEKLDDEISDMIAGRNGNGNKKDELVISTIPIRSYKLKCPQCPDGVLTHEEGCQKCHTCGFSKC